MIAITGIYDSRHAAEQAVKDLLAEGFYQNNISLRILDKKLQSPKDRTGKGKRYVQENDYPESEAQSGNKRSTAVTVFLTVSATALAYIIFPSQGALITLVLAVVLFSMLASLSLGIAICGFYKIPEKGSPDNKMPSYPEPAATSVTAFTDNESQASGARAVFRNTGIQSFTV